MNQSSAFEEMIGGSEPLDAAEGKREEKKVPIDFLKLDDTDRKLQDAAKTSLRALLEAKKKIGESQEVRLEKNPFHTAQRKHTANQLVSTMLQTEIEFARMIKFLLYAEEKDRKITHFTEEDLLDMAGFLSYTQSIMKTHQGHIEQLLQLVIQCVNGSEERYKASQKAVLDVIKCANHPEEKAISRSIDNGTLLCEKCIREQLENMNTKE